MTVNAELTYTDINGVSLTEQDIACLSALIPPYFQEKIRRSGTVEQKRERLAAGLLLADSLSRMGYKAAEADITEGAQGKPGLKEPGGLYFNLSHSAGRVLMAVSDTEVGCDIQKIRNGGRRIAERFFTPEEKQVLEQVPVDERDMLFTRLWARKESYIKATGEGMKRDLGSFSVLADETGDGFYFTGRDVEGYAVCACFRAPGGALERHGDWPELRFIPFQNMVNVI